MPSVLTGSAALHDRAIRAAVEMRLVGEALVGRKQLIGYTRTHPVYQSVFEENPPLGFSYYRTPRWRPLRLFDNAAWRKISLFHHDASTELPVLPPTTPLVVSCEGRPNDRFFRDDRFQHVFVHSRWAGGDLLAGGRVELLRLAPPLQPPRQPRNKSRDLVLLTVGLGGMVKGLDIAVRAYERLKKQFSIRLIIAGALAHNPQWYPEITRDGLERARFDDLQRRIELDSRITLAQYSRRVLLKHIYKGADIYLQASRMDTYPFATLEAMSFGLPVVATRLNSIPEMVREAENGFLVDHAGIDMNSEEWAERAVNQTVAALSRLLGDEALRECMGVASRDRLQAAFSIDYARSRLASVYRGILDLER